MTSPFILTKIYQGLTSKNQLLKRKLKLGTDEIPIPPKRDDVTTIEAINRFNKANPRVDTTNLKPLSVKHSNVKQSNVNEPDEGVIQGAFDTATREAQSEGFPAPNYEKFKSRYLKKNMKADGGRIGYKDGPKMFDVQASGTKSGKQQIEGAPEGITSDKETINAILTMDIPLTEKVNLIGDPQYGKFRDKIEYKDDEIFLDDPKSYRNRNIGLDYNRGGEGFSGSATVGDEGPAFNIRYKKSFADGGMLVQPSDDGSRPGYADDKKKSSGFASEETQKKIQKIIEEKTTKRVDQIKKINDWTNNWFENNAGKYDSYEKTKKQLIKDWSKESKNKKYVGNFKLSLENGLPNIAAGTAESSKATRVSNRIFDLNFPIQRSNKELIFQKGYANYRLQNPNFNKKINDYFDLIILDKRSYDVQQNLIQSGKLKEGYGVIRTATGDYTGSSSKSMKGKQALDALNIDKEVLEFITTYMKPDSAFFTKTGGENIYDIVGKHVDPEKVNSYRNKISMGVDNWRANLDAVVDLANKDLPPSKHLSSSQLISQMNKESKKMSKIFNVKDLPPELKFFGYSQDHLLGIREALELGDPRIARQTLNTISGSTRAQNTFLGFKEFGNQRRKLIKDFNAVPPKARGPIIEKLNLLSKEFIPGELEYGVRKDGSMKIKVLNPQKTQASRIESYKKVLGESFDIKTPEGRLNMKKLNTSVAFQKFLKDNGIVVPGCGRQKVVTGGRITFSNGTCGGFKNADEFAKGDPEGFLNTVKADPKAAQLINNADVGAMKGAFAWAANDIKKPTGWLGGDLAVSTVFTANALMEGKTPLEALDQGLLWFVPNEALKIVGMGDSYKKSLTEGMSEGEAIRIKKALDLENADKQYLTNEAELKSLETQIQQNPDLFKQVTAEQIQNSKNRLLTNIEEARVDGTRILSDLADRQGTTLPGTATTDKNTIDAFNTSMDNLFTAKKQKAIKESNVARQFDIGREYQKYLNDLIMPDIIEEKLGKGNKNYQDFDILGDKSGLFTDFFPSLTRPFAPVTATIGQAAQGYASTNLPFADKLQNYLENIAISRGKENLTQPITMDNLTQGDFDISNQYGEGLKRNYASGGIASLTDTIPPESGPTPHGLPYVYNNVKKI